MNIDTILKQNPAVAIYFSAPNCSVCHALKPKLFARFEDEFDKLKIVEVDTSLDQEIAAKFSVFAIPTLLVFLEAKEYVRKSRHMSVDEVIGSIKRPYDMMFS